MLSSEGSSIIKESTIPKKIAILLFRLFLGGALLVKGVDFIRNKVVLKQLISKTEYLDRFSFIEVAIPWIHVLGGVLIAIGMYTRIVILIQIPIVIGAVLVLLNTKNTSFQSPELIFAVIILIMLFIYLKFGDGFYSWRNLIRKEKDVV